MPKEFTFPVSSVRVAGRRIDIVRDPNNTDSWGDYCHDARLIRLSDAVNDLETFRTTVSHELVHAALAMSGLSHLMTDGMEEAVVRCFENLLLPAMDDLDAKMKRK